MASIDDAEWKCEYERKNSIEFSFGDTTPKGGLYRSGETRGVLSEHLGL